MTLQRVVIAAIFTILFGLLLFLAIEYNQPSNKPISPNNILKDFAGDYYTNADFISTRLSIKPDQTFTLATRTDTGDSDEYSGKFTITFDKINLIPTEEDSLDIINLALVKWGSQRYLVYMDFISQFCESVSDTTKSWSIRGVGFRYYQFLRESDRYKPAFGYPTSPQNEKICP